MKKFTQIALATWLVVASAQSAEKPNILFIFADDMAVNTINALGNHEVETPNLDRLVNGGTTFTHAYNSGAWHGAVCVASRTMLQTGLQVWNAKKAEPKLATDFLKKKRFWPQLMEQGGYETFFAGKWHVGSAAGKGELCTGAFNHTANVRAGMPHPKGKSGYNRPKNKDDHDWKPWDKSKEGYWQGGKHWSEVLADDGEKYLSQVAKSKKPFFMMLAFNAPHDPRQAPKEFCDKYPYNKIKVPENFLPEYPYEICNNRNLRDEKLAPFPRTPYAIQVNRSEYYALITHMDVQIGRILDALKKSGKADNTYIIFTADHGLACGEHGLMGKQNMFDHSVRVPWVIVGPNIPKAKKIGSPIYLQDAMATTLELGGVSKPAHVEFQSVLPHIKGDAKGRETIYGCYMDKQRMVSTKKHKLIYYPQIDVELLFDLEKDPHEITDVAKNPAYAKVLQDMQKRLSEQMEAMGDPLLKRAD